MREVLVPDWELLVDLEIEYSFDPYDKFIELDRVAFLGTCILSSLTDNQINKLIDWIADNDLYRHEE